jgi:hypothetical protein
MERPDAIDALPANGLSSGDADMTRYKPEQPRFALGLAALIMTVMTVGAMVVLPSRLEGGDASASAVATRPSREVADSSIQGARHSAVETRSGSATRGAIRLN